MIEKTSSGMTQGMIAKLVSVLEATLSKLGRYDEGSLIGSILSFTVKCGIIFLIEIQFERKIRIIHEYFQNVSGTGKDMGQAYVNFTRNCMDQIRSKVNDELWILNFFEVSIIFFN